MSSDQQEFQGLALPEAVLMTDSGLSWDSREQILDSESKGMVETETEDTLEIWLERWIEQRCTGSVDEAEKVRQFNEASRRIAQDERFWHKRRGNCDSDYSDCFFVMLDYFKKWLCTVPDDKKYSDEKESFYEARYRAVPRLLIRRRGCLKAQVANRAKEAEKVEKRVRNPDEAPISEEEIVADPSINPYLVLVMTDYVERDPSGKLKELCNSDWPDVNMQAFLRFWLQGKTIQEMAEEFSQDGDNSLTEQIYNAISERNSIWWQEVSSWWEKLNSWAENRADYKRQHLWMLNYVEEDVKGDLKATHIRDRPDVNMQAFLQFWLKGMKVKAMAEEFCQGKNDIESKQLYNAISSRNPSWWKKVNYWKQKLKTMAEDSINGELGQ